MPQAGSEERDSMRSKMVNFKRKLDWAKGCPGSRENVILSMSLRVFLQEISI